MDLKDYEEFVYMMANPEVRESSRQGLLMGAIGCSEEAGEVLGLVKKVIFHDHPLDQTKLIKELGDLQWYLTLTAISNGITLNEILEANVDKLTKRYPNGFESIRSKNRDPEDV